MAKGIRQYSNDREARTTAFGLWRFANEYRHSGQLMHEAVGGDYSDVAMFLMYHSIELGLKAFLRSRGATLGVLESLGHDLKALHKEAMRLHLNRLWPEAGACEGIVHGLADANTGHAFRYIVNGHNSVPQWAFVEGTAYGLTKALYKHCLRRTFGRAQGKKLEQTRAGLRNSKRIHLGTKALRKSRAKG